MESLFDLFKSELEREAPKKILTDEEAMRQLLPLYAYYEVDPKILNVDGDFAAGSLESQVSFSHKSIFEQMVLAVRRGRLEIIKKENNEVHVVLNLTSKNLQTGNSSDALENEDRIVFKPCKAIYRSQFRKKDKSGSGLGLGIYLLSRMSDWSQTVLEKIEEKADADILETLGAFFSAY